MRSKGLNLLRKLLDIERAKVSTSQESDYNQNSAPQLNSHSLKPNRLGATAFEISKAMDFLDSTADDDDELEKYLSATFSKSVRQELKAIHGVALFWAKSQHAYHFLSKVALRIMATPASSATSERDFRDVNRIFTPERSTLDPALINDILFLKSYENIE